MTVNLVAALAPELREIQRNFDDAMVLGAPREAFEDLACNAALRIERALLRLAAKARADAW